MRYVSMARAMKVPDGVLWREPQAVHAVDECRIRVKRPRRSIAVRSVPAKTEEILVLGTETPRARS